MNKTVLEQALEHLLNKEEDKASSLLHDYYVGIGRRVYEDIMADELEQTDEDQELLDDAADAVDEVESDLVEVEDDSEEMSDDAEAAAADDMAADMDAEPSAEPVAGDAADVADAMVDVESALAKLKAEFEDMLSGGAAEDDSAEASDMEAADKMESIDESAELEKVAAPDNGDKADEKHSPVAGKNPMMARPAVKIGAGSAEGVASGTKPAAAPKAQDLGGTTKPALSKVKA